MSDVVIIFSAAAIVVGIACMVNRLDAYRFKRRPKPSSDRMAVGE